MNLPNLLGHVMSSISRHWLSDEYNRKRHFIRARSEARFYENFKKSLTTRESNIGLISCKKNQCPAKGLCQNKQLEKCPKSLKIAKILTLRLVSRVTRARIIKILMFITIRKVSWNNIKNLQRYSQKKCI